MIIAQRCKPIPMSNNVIKVINQMGEDDGILNGIGFCNILKESILDNVYGDVNSQDDSTSLSTNASERFWSASAQ